GVASGAYRALLAQGDGFVGVGDARPQGRPTTELVVRHGADGAVMGSATGYVSLGQAADVRVRGAAAGGDGVVAIAALLEDGADDAGLFAVAQADGAAIQAIRDVDAMSTRDRFLAVARTANGFVLVGETAGDLLVEHLDAQGSPVAAFGDQGRLVLNVAGGRDVARGVVVQPDGGVVVVGSAEEEGVSRFLVLRLTAAGAPDAGFGDQGSTLLDFGAPAEDAVGFGVALDPRTDQIVAVGAAGPAASRHAVIVRLGR
ncbi:MAG: hypothetical protein KC549_11425, partial [Myxococcales bacterium]|nr:hypothetical protein [Myxococcales bacterium]